MRQPSHHLLFIVIVSFVCQRIIYLSLDQSHQTSNAILAWYWGVQPRLGSPPKIRRIHPHYGPCSSCLHSASDIDSGSSRIIGIVSGSVEHSSGWHRENVTVTGIAFHSGQSWLWGDASLEKSGDNDGESSPSMAYSNNNNPTTNVLWGKSMQGWDLLVIDMSRCVHWGFTLGLAPDHMRHLLPWDQCRRGCTQYDVFKSHSCQCHDWWF